MGSHCFVYNVNLERIDIEVINIVHYHSKHLSFPMACS